MLTRGRRGSKLQCKWHVIFAARKARAAAKLASASKISAAMKHIIKGKCLFPQIWHAEGETVASSAKLNEIDEALRQCGMSNALCFGRPDL